MVPGMPDGEHSMGDEGSMHAAAQGSRTVVLNRADHGLISAALLFCITGSEVRPRMFATALRTHSSRRW
jgi:hypothetical protein